MKNILKKLNAIQKEVTHLDKMGFNEHGKYNYLAEYQITQMFKPLFEKHGVMFTFSSKKTGEGKTPSEKQINTDISVSYKFVDVDTAEEVAGEIAGTGADQTDKGVYKATTGAIKYLFMKTFMIPTGDDPEDDTGHKYDTKTTKVPRVVGTDTDDELGF